MVDQVELPPFARPVRTLARGAHPFLEFLPGVAESPAFERIGAPGQAALAIVRAAVVEIRAVDGYCWIDESVPCIVFGEGYYRTGSDLNLYLDLLHEVTHIRQHHEGKGLWDPEYEYHRRPTEIEGYAVAVEEGRRLGMGKAEIVEHLSNPWMTAAQVKELLTAIDAFLVGSS